SSTSGRISQASLADPEPAPTSVREIPKRDVPSSMTTTSPLAMTRPFTTTSTGSPTRRSNGITAPRPRLTSPETDVVAEPKTTWTATGMRMMASRLPAAGDRDCGDCCDPGDPPFRDCPKEEASTSGDGVSSAANSWISRSCLAVAAPGGIALPAEWEGRSCLVFWCWTVLPALDGARSSRKDVIHELLLAIDKPLDAQRVNSIRLAHFAPQQRLAIAIDANGRTRRRLQRQDLTDTQRGDLRQCPWTVFQHGTHHELGAIDFSTDLLGPSRVGSPSSAKRRTCESRFQGGQDRIGNGQLELTAASPSLQPISRNRDRSMRAAESIRIGPTYVTIRREGSGCGGREGNLQGLSGPGATR